VLICFWTVQLYLWFSFWYLALFYATILINLLTYLLSVDMLLMQVVWPWHDRHSVHWLRQDNGIRPANYHVLSRAGETFAVRSQRGTIWSRHLPIGGLHIVSLLSAQMPLACQILGWIVIINAGVWCNHIARLALLETIVTILSCVDSLLLG